MNALKISGALTLLSIFAAIAMAMHVPSDLMLPIHWNIHGQVDNVVNARIALFFPPMLMVVIIAGSLLLKYLEPRKQHLAQSGQAIFSIVLAITVMLGLLELGYVLLSLGIDFNMSRLVFFGVGVMFVLMGNYFGKVRSNFFIGIRTPWTLSNDTVWQKTHRLAGKLCVAAGLIAAIAIWFIPVSWSGYLVLGLLLPSVLFPAAYSWWLWKAEQKS